MIFDISSIPAGTPIDKIVFHGFVNDTQQPNWSITPLSVFPPTSSANDIYTDINAEATNPGDCYYFADEDPSFAVGWKTIELQNSANIDLQNALDADWFGFGIVNRNNDFSHWIDFDGWNEPNIPYLEIISYTHISGGDISGTLLYADSPFVIDGDLTVQPEDFLDIEPNVIIYFSGDFSLTVLGTITTQFEPNDTIRFQPLDDFSIWRGIKLGDNFGMPAQLQFMNVFMKNADIGLEILSGDAMIDVTTILKDTLIVRDSSDVGVKISGTSNTGISNSEITGYKIGIEISNTSGAETTPTVLNTRVRNSTESSRTDRIGISISGLVAATIENCQIIDYPYGIKYVGDGSTLSSTPTVLNTRVRNSTESSRDSTLITGFYLEDLQNISLETDTLDGYETGIEIINNSVSMRAESTPTVLNTRVRNSTESSRTDSYGIKMTGNVSAEIDSSEIDDYSYAIKCENSGGNFPSPVLTNSRLRNSAESVRTLAKGIYIIGNINFNIASNEFINCDSTFICRNADSTSVQIEHNIIYEESSVSNSCALYSNNVDSLLIFNNTVHNFDCGLNVESVDTCSFYNNILWNVTSPIQSSGSTLSVTYCDIDGGYSGNGNIDTNPVFNDTDNDDFSLQWNSPCIDAGTGIDPDSTVADMGAIYFLQSGTPSEPQNLQTSVSNDSLNISWNESSNTIYYNVYSSSDPYSGWSLESEKVRATSWATPISTQKKFYYIKAMNGIPE